MVSGPRHSMLLPIKSPRRLADKSERQNAPVNPREYIIGLCYCPYSAVYRTTGLMYLGFLMAKLERLVGIGTPTQYVIADQNSSETEGQIREAKGSCHP